MSKTIKIYTRNKHGQLTTSRMTWEGDYPPEPKTLKGKGFEKLATIGDEYGMNCDIYSYDKGWLILAWVFQEYVATFKFTDPLDYINYLESLTETCRTITKGLELATND